ncbi:MAG: YceD family protein [Candidatus Methylopumilus sp.]
MEQHIDNIDFSRKSREIRDIIRLSDFKRLQDLCLNLEDSIVFVLRGFENKYKELCLELSIEGKLSLICQRCSEKLEHTIFLKSGFLIKEETQLTDFQVDDHADYDLIEGSAKMDVLSLIEDEIILSLPVAPKHESDKCYYKKTDEMPGRIHPFADLKQKLYKN